MLIWSGEIDDAFLKELFKETQLHKQLVLCSHGGDCSIMAAAWDLLRQRDWVVGGTGIIASAAVPVLAAGAKGHRTATANTRFMIHNVWTEVGEASADDLQTVGDELKFYDELYCKILADCTKKSLKWWKTQSGKKDYWFGAEDAQKFGIIDNIE